MVSTSNTPVDVIQQFIALQNTRKEAAERLGGNEPNGGFNQARVSADKAIGELMGELSEFGDASKGDINKENKLFAIWEHAVTTLENSTVEQKERTLAEMETALKESYTRTLSEETGLPESTKEILERQLADLVRIFHVMP